MYSFLTRRTRIMGFKYYRLILYTVLLQDEIYPVCLRYSGPSPSPSTLVSENRRYSTIYDVRVYNDEACKKNTFFLLYRIFFSFVVSSDILYYLFLTFITHLDFIRYHYILCNHIRNVRAALCISSVSLLTP